jgi:hypothetical protein
MRRSRVNIGVFPAILVLSALSSSCWFQKKPVAFTPPPPKEQPKIPTEAVMLPGPPMIAGNPNLPPVVPFSVQMGNVDVSGPPAPKDAPHRNTVPTPTRTTPPAVADPPTPPRLGPVFTADQRRAYTRTLDESLDRVRRALEFLSTKNLTAEQAAARDKVSTFQKQAEQAREQDLVLAVNLAHNADVLAKDLVARVSQ